MNILNIESHEKEHWDSYYLSALENANYSMKHKKWWDIADEELKEIVLSYFSISNKYSILESGCGSASSSYALVDIIKELHLLDISDGSLEYAKKTIPDGMKEKTSFHKGSVFSQPFENDRFDLVWNCGVVEHYSPDLIIDMVEEMTRVTKKGGYVVIGIPNTNSLEMIKTKILSNSYTKRLLSWIPGYRIDSEIPYSNRAMKEILKRVSSVNYINMEYAGNLSIEDSPDWLINLTQKFCRKSKFSFLTVFVLKKN